MTTRKTEPARAQSTRRGRGYPSDLTDAQWQVIAAHLPAERPGRRGRPRIWPLRRIVEAILYLDRTGCARITTKAGCFRYANQAARRAVITEATCRGSA